jgi:hypothetical protein
MTFESFKECFWSIAMQYEVRELGLGGILDQAINLTKNHFGQLFSIVAVSLLPLLILNAVVDMTIMPPPPTELTLESLQAYRLARREVLMKHYPLIMTTTLLSILVVPITNAALIHSIAGTYLSKPKSRGEALGTAFRSILSLYWTWILVMVAIMGGLILFIIPGILAAFWFSLATQVVVIERISGFSALKRSRYLMVGNIGRMFVLGLVLGVISIGLQLAAGMIPQEHLQEVANIVIQGVFTVFGSVATVIFYFSARCRHEQFDLQLLAANLEAGQTETEDTRTLREY